MSWRHFFNIDGGADAHVPENNPDMGDVMRRVDEQIGRAVTRLSDR